LEATGILQNRSMPITPLHFGLMAPVNKYLPGRISWISFVLVNLWIDIEAILAVVYSEPLPGHDHWNHTFVGATLIAVFIGMLGVRSWSWVLGAFTGAWSHILLDSLVHTDMNPFKPVIEGNPLYLGIMEPLSWFLTPLTIWFIAQIVSGTLAKVQTHLAQRQAQTAKPDA
jgi:membrane-bound metal-dependent hydrolase YbcI (DUF457 family)